MQLHKAMITNLNLPVCLRLKGGKKFQSSTIISIRSSRIAHELNIPIGHDESGKTIKYNNLLKDKLSNMQSIISLALGNNVGHLRKPIDCNQKLNHLEMS